jgi:hypothetical protein
MKYFYLLFLVSIQFIAKSQDLSGKWTGRHEVHNGYTSFENKHNMEINMVQSGNQLSGTSKCTHVSSGKYTICRLSGLIIGNQVILVENEITEFGISLSSWCIEFCRGDLVVDSVANKLIITGHTTKN